MKNFKKTYFPKSKFAFAISGGADSLAACHFLNRGKMDFVAVHFNNKFIPQDDTTAIHVEKFCKQNKIPYVILECNKTYKKGSKEDFCRKARYDAIGEYCRKTKIKYVVTAHHLNDCVESYFMNFLKGTPEYIPIPYICKYEKFTVVRPFLLNKKLDFTEYLAYNNLTKLVVEDEMNKDMTLMRNWTRNKVLPIIEEKYKGLYKVVFKKMKKHLDAFSLT